MCLLKYPAALLRKTLHVFRSNYQQSAAPIESEQRHDILNVYMCLLVNMSGLSFFLNILSPSYTFLTKPHHHPKNIAQPACLCNTISPSVVMHSHLSAPLTLISLRHMTCEIAFYTHQVITNV